MIFSSHTPLAIAMWDFSWLERRFPGGGFEDWDRALDELQERGYDAVRIDACPHLIATDPQARWTLKPIWTVHDWGAPFEVEVQVLPHLLTFLEKCALKGIKVALSSWFREDTSNVRMGISTTERLGQVWNLTLQHIRNAGLMDTVLFVDLCNEFPGELWAPFLQGQPGFMRHSQPGRQWMQSAIQTVRLRNPDLPLTFSFNTELENGLLQDTSMLDLLEVHLWMAQSTDFYGQVGYEYPRFDLSGYQKLAEKGEKLYRQNAESYQIGLQNQIASMARWSRHADLPLVTTEGWAVVDYLDLQGLDWGWVKELCELGVLEAARTGRWVAQCTSNFCSPQFKGMWQDVSWHQRLTRTIHESPIDPSLTRKKEHHV